jgi:hypothetical protein
MFLLISCQGYKFTPAYASYAPHCRAGDVEESLKDRSLVQLSYSNLIYDNVGMLYYRNATSRTVKESDFIFSASVVYIGDGICLTSAHTHAKLFDMTNKNSAVCFEIDGKITPFYHVAEYFIHPEYEKNIYFDIAALVLDKPVDGLTGLEPCYAFSEKQWGYNGCYAHLLTYVGYGVKLLCHDWFSFTDYQRRAMQAYTHSCITKSSNLGIYSTPYGNSNDFKQKRPLFPYEEKGRAGLSGGAGIHPNFGLVSIIEGSAELKGTTNFSTYVYLIFAHTLNFFIFQIDYYLFPTVFFNTSVINDTSRIQSVPLGPVKDWLEEIRMKKRMLSV